MLDKVLITSTFCSIVAVATDPSYMLLLTTFTMDHTVIKALTMVNIYSMMVDGLRLWLKMFTFLGSMKIFTAAGVHTKEREEFSLSVQGQSVAGYVTLRQTGTIFGESCWNSGALLGSLQ